MTEYDTLKRVIIGRESLERTRAVDFTLKNFFKDNLAEKFHHEEFVSYELTDQVLSERREDLDAFADTLSRRGIEVVRPIEQKNIKHIKTPDFNSICMNNSNVRDLTLTLDNMIITTPPSVRTRYFEHTHLSDIFAREFHEHNKIIVGHPPITLQQEKIDLDHWSNTRDYDQSKSFEILFDAANCIKVTDTDIIFNATNYNNYNGYKWLKRILPSNINLHLVHITDNHIDGTILPLCEGVFLINSAFQNKPIKDLLPDKFKKWRMIEAMPDKLDPVVYDQTPLTAPRLATVNGMNINVLSIDSKTVCVQHDALIVKELLYKHGFDIIEVKLRHSVMFGGGLHCSSLDLEREK